MPPMDATDYEPRSTYAAIALPPAGLRLSSRAPSPGLARWVSRVWTLESGEAEGASRTLPDGCIDLIVNLTTEGEARAYVAGLQSEASSFSYGKSERAIAVRLRPGAALALLDTPIDGLTDDRVSLEALIGRSALDLEEQLSAATSRRERVLTLEAFLGQRLGRPRSDARVDRALAILLQTSGAVSMRELTREAGASPRTLDRLFHQWVGTSPKRFALIVRFQEALARAAAFPTRSWAALAAELGFSDHAHLTREFVRFTGVSPSRLLPHRAARMADFFKAGPEAGTTEGE